MQRPCRRPSRPHRQLDLGLPSLPVPAIPPAWCALPELTQRTLTELLSSLLIAHAGDAVPELDGRMNADTDER